VARSPDADRELAAARRALARGAVEPAVRHAWLGAAAAATVGDEGALSALLDLAGRLVPLTTGREHDDAERLTIYVGQCLDDARRGTRPPSAFERLLSRDRAGSLRSRFAARRDPGSAGNTSVTVRREKGAPMSDTAAADWNRQIIEEFRANGGRVGGPFEGAPMLLLHHAGARSGVERVNPLVYQPAGDGFAVFASKGGAPVNPGWYHNLLANPETTVEVGDATLRVRARVAEGEERERLWAKQKQDRPAFAAYDRQTSRQIPVVVLERVG
jgi:deazaflavin-dependent oxidoreductase (nitroreductase family)